jgi:hypothetical protein
MGAKQIKEYRGRGVGEELQVSLDGNQRSTYGMPESDAFFWKKVNGEWSDIFCVGSTLKPFTSPVCQLDELQWEKTTQIAKGGQKTTCYDRNRTRNYDPDWPSGLVVGKGTQDVKRCAHILKDDGRVCPQFDNGRVKPSRATAKKPDQFDDQYGINCFYDLGDVSSSCTAARGYTKKVRDQTGNREWFDDRLMSILCRNGTTDCQHKSGDFKKFLDSGHKCSNLLNCDLCREWYEHQMKIGHGTDVDLIIDEWCSAPENFNPDSPADPTKSDPACKCVKRTYDPDYRKFHEAMEYASSMEPASCWYKYCTDPGSGDYFVREPDQNKEDCRDICQQIINVAKEAHIEDVHDIYAILSCKESPSVGPNESFEKVALIGGVSVVAIGCALLIVSYVKSK